METKPDDPVNASLHTPWLKGLTKREYFAVMALQSLMLDFTPKIQHPAFVYKSIVNEAVEYADNLIEELNKTK